MHAYVHTCTCTCMYSVNSREILASETSILYNSLTEEIQPWLPGAVVWEAESWPVMDLPQPLVKCAQTETCDCEQHSVMPCPHHCPGNYTTHTQKNVFNFKINLSISFLKSLSINEHCFHIYMYVHHFKSCTYNYIMHISTFVHLY